MTIGILGGGQLGRMLALAGYPLGLRFRVLDHHADAPAGQVAPLIVGEFSDPAVLRNLAEGCAAVTFEFENVPVLSARMLQEFTIVYPPPAALEVAQDRLAEKQFFQRLGIPVGRFAQVSSTADLAHAARETDLPAVLKTRRMGYDGKGQVRVQDAESLAAAHAALQPAPTILEQFVRFDRELSVLALRSRDGKIACYPLVENVHVDGILHVSRAPAPNLTTDLQARAADYARRALDALNYVGLLAIEFFQVGDELLANEMAPRVHNSGHWTIEGAETSQFENHLRAVLGLPLGSCAPRGHSAMVNLIGAAPPLEHLTASGACVHLYGKSPRAGRKLGHCTLFAATAEERERRLAEFLAQIAPTVRSG